MVLDRGKNHHFKKCHLDLTRHLNDTKDATENPIAGCQKCRWIEKKKGLYFPATSTFHPMFQPQHRQKGSWVSQELLIRGWRARTPVLVNAHPTRTRRLLWNKIFPLDQREGGTGGGEYRVQKDSQGDFTTKNHRTLVQSDRLSIIYVKPLYSLHHNCLNRTHEENVDVLSSWQSIHDTFLTQGLESRNVLHKVHGSPLRLVLSLSACRTQMILLSEKQPPFWFF